MHGSFKNIDLEDCGLIIFLIHFTLSPEILSTKWLLTKILYIYFIESTLRQEGGLQDVAIEVLHLLVVHLIRNKDNFGIGNDQKEAFLSTLRKGSHIIHYNLFNKQKWIK